MPSKKEQCKAIMLQYFGPATASLVDQMNEDELNASMNALGIELPDDEGDADDYDYDDYDDAPAQEPDYLQELERLAALRDQGVITNEDFEAKKQQLLGL